MADNKASGSGQAAPAAPENATNTNQSQAQSTTEPETVGILPPAHWTQAAEVEGFKPAFFGSEEERRLNNFISTSSITSSILEYRTIQGRSYHSETGNAQYWASNDDKQNESMDINHHLLTLCLGGRLFLAPIKSDIKKAMDVGTGTGIWAIDFADEYPDIEVVGTDISPIQPSWVPPNLKFEIEDCTQNWTFPPNSFDYIHIRFLVGSIVDWTELFRQAYRCLKPGGYLESYEASPCMESDDGTVGPQSAMSQWGKFFVEGGRKLGRTFLVVNEEVQRKAMEDAGYVEIDEWNFKAPIGPWSSDPRLREIGQYARFTLDQDYEGYVLFMASVMEGWTTEEIQVYIATLRREVRSGNYHPYYRQKVVWGRKPEAE